MAQYNTAVGARQDLNRRLRFKRGVRSVAIDVLGPDSFGLVVGASRSLDNVPSEIEGVPVRVVVEGPASVT